MCWIQVISLPPPCLGDNTADAERLARVLKMQVHADSIEVSYALLKDMPDMLRQWGYKTRCIVFQKSGKWHLIGITDPLDTKPIAGLAVDLGTTRIAMRIVDLSNGQALAESDFDNPQIAIGSDILTRIHFAETQHGIDTLKNLIVDGLNTQIKELCRSCNISPDNIWLISLAGNTAMTHLFMGLNPRWLIREPYIPVVNNPGLIKATELGIHINPLAKIFIFPNIGSYFGGDLIAGILFSGINKSEDTSMLIDVGTNAEVLLGNKNWLIACAGAAGPALEGGVTKMGMTAKPGVIDRVAIDHKTRNFDLHTIGDLKPIGICGSGLIDLAAGLFLSGMIDIRARFIPSACGQRLKEIEGIYHLIVVPAKESSTGQDLTISQADIDSLIRSKAAMFTILETITISVGMSLNDISTFYVAGTFGSLINPLSAISIGMLPDLPLEKYKPIGNSSLCGAVLALTSPEHARQIDGIRDSITYLELNVNQEFMNRFSASKFLPHTDISRFPSVVNRKS